MQKFILNFALLGGLVAPLCAAAAPAALVTNGLDAGSGSLRAALESGATRVIIKPEVSNIVLETPLTYDGTEPLRIFGSDQVISWSSALPTAVPSTVPSGGDGPLLHVSKGANLYVSRLAFEGPGGYSIENQGGGKGIFVEVPEDRQGQVKVQLRAVSISNTGNHGLHIRDCNDDACGAGQGAAGTGSPASMILRLTDVHVDGVGFGKQDADGVRVDDRGDGDILLVATNSTFSNVGGDGIELDEGDEGTVKVNVRNSQFDSNGAYCFDYDGDGPFDPISVDPACNDDGDPDVDDAFDIDEAGGGGIEGIIRNVEVVDNYDEGLDFDSAGEGPGNFVDLRVIKILASGNADEGIKVSEEGDASVLVSMRFIDAEGDVEVEEEGNGDLEVILKNSVIGDDLKLSEKDDGIGTAKLRWTVVGDELDFDNVDEI